MIVFFFANYVLQQGCRVGSRSDSVVLGSSNSTEPRGCNIIFEILISISYSISCIVRGTTAHVSVLGKNQLPARANIVTFSRDSLIALLHKDSQWTLFSVAVRQRCEYFSRQKLVSILGVYVIWFFFPHHRSCLTAKPPLSWHECVIKTLQQSPHHRHTFMGLPHST